jgi:bifunctional pyridoxal-dependent enzyme with beta-cystathionase and maltose regulon repressor activities
MSASTPAQPSPSFDLPTEHALRAAGSLKWSRYGPALGAFVAEMDFGTAPAVRQALHAAVDGHRLGYLTERASADMARACAAWQQRRYGWEVPPAWITPVSDVLAALQAVIELYTPPGSPVVLPTPAYMPFLALPAMLGRPLIQVPMVEREGRPAYTEGEPWLTEVLAYLDGNRRALADLVAEHLPQVGYRLPEGTYLAWLDCRDLRLPASPGAFFLERAGVALVDGPECGAAGAGHVRLNLATPRPVLTTIVARMAEAVRGR